MEEYVERISASLKLPHLNKSTVAGSCLSSSDSHGTFLMTQLFTSKHIVQMNVWESME